MTSEGVQDIYDWADADDVYPPDGEHTFVWRQVDAAGTLDNHRPWCEDHGVWVHTRVIQMDDTEEEDRTQWIREHRPVMTISCNSKQKPKQERNLWLKKAFLSTAMPQQKLTPQQEMHLAKKEQQMRDTLLTRMTK